LVNVGVLTLAWFCSGLGLAAVIPWIPNYIQTWHLDWIQAGLVLVITAFPLVFVGPLTKWMSKKLGKNYAKWIVAISLAIMTLAALGCAYAPNFYALMIFRFIEGIGVFSIFLVGVMAVIPWFGMQNMMSLLPRFSYVGIAALSIAFTAVLMFWGPIGAAFGYQLAQLYTFVPVFGISALLVAGLVKEAK